VRRKTNAVFVLTDPSEPRTIIGYFSLCATAVSLGDVPEILRRRLPRHPLVSATLVGRLAVARERQGSGVGAALLSRAWRRGFRLAGDARRSRGASFRCGRYPRRG